MHFNGLNHAAKERICACALVQPNVIGVFRAQSLIYWSTYCRNCISSVCVCVTKKRLNEVSLFTSLRSVDVFCPKTIQSRRENNTSRISRSFLLLIHSLTKCFQFQTAAGRSDVSHRKRPKYAAKHKRASGSRWVSEAYGGQTDGWERTGRLLFVYSRRWRFAWLRSLVCSGNAQSPTEAATKAFLAETKENVKGNISYGVQSVSKQSAAH